ncbi:HNH endonuclease signature motif containing protein [Mobilicoccus massiliensis]|uniref:HNH endonuclease signature motif containing protein n=1 Tax=Mobilicoccus massiliensis TaxID=1522310 RepID=UPI000693C259|nr:HNH endonuclease signature motif containing protein [Mobilicoccus massiliensis]
MTSTPFLPSPSTSGEDAAAQLAAVREVLERVAEGLVSVPAHELAGLAAAATAVVAAAEAARAAVVLEASSRGVIAASDHPRTHRWVEQSCRDAGVPVAKGRARQLDEITRTCAGVDVHCLREAVVAGRLPMETAALVAKVYRRLRVTIEYPHWDDLMEILIDWAASGASRAELERLEDVMIGQYGRATELDAEHDRDHRKRELTAFTRDRAGMLCATLRLDEASEAVFTAAIHALSAPRLDDDGLPDPRTSGQRRADALLTLAGVACDPDEKVSGTGAKARVVVTMKLSDLLSGLNERGRLDATERGYATTGFSQVLSPTEARILACDAEIVPAVLGTRGEVLELGRTSRTVTPGQRMALHLRDKGCTYPGCSMPPAWCDGHHIIHWAAGGLTHPPNLALLCRHHHTVVHRHDHTATVDPVDGVRWTRRDGTPIGITPRTPAVA